jgi:hypothetical protein
MGLSVGDGRILMDEIECYLFVAAKKGSTIGLLSAKGKKAFIVVKVTLKGPVIL